MVSCAGEEDEEKRAKGEKSPAYLAVEENATFARPGAAVPAATEVVRKAEIELVRAETVLTILRDELRAVRAR